MWKSKPACVSVEKPACEMEAMTAVAVAGLTIYDICKAVDREMSIGEIRLVKRAAAKSGTFLEKNNRLPDPLLRIILKRPRSPRSPRSSLDFPGL